MAKAKELVIISGKGGTGKTSVTAAFANLASQPVLADCDVDAADLHLVLAPKVREHHEFVSGNEAVVREADCTGCGECAQLCRYQAIAPVTGVSGEAKYAVDPLGCEGCGVCVRWCPAGAISFPRRTCGEWFISNTRCGTLVHARLKPAAENSGRLVSLVREHARSIAEAEAAETVLIDGPPGIGCPVVASITGADLVMVVTEPSLSGEHDLDRVLKLAAHFEVPAALCVNKWDINPEITKRIEDRARESGARVAGRLSYDEAFTRAQTAGLSVVELGRGPAAEQAREVWGEVCSML